MRSPDLKRPATTAVPDTDQWLADNHRIGLMLMTSVNSNLNAPAWRRELALKLIKIGVELVDPTLDPVRAMRCIDAIRDEAAKQIPLPPLRRAALMRRLARLA